MSAFLDTINKIDDIPTGAVKPGKFIWLHGAKQAKTPGVFYAKATEFEAEPAAPWHADDRFSDDQHEERGFSAAQLKIAVLGWRSQWYLLERDSNKPPDYLATYTPGAKKHVEVLCFVEGIEPPMVLSLSSVNKAKPIEDLIRSYRDGLLKQASRMAKRQLPLWSFWLPIANERNGNGQPRYIEAQDAAGKTYGSVVTPPKLYLPENALDVLFVGEALLRRGYEVMEQYAAWVEARRLPAGVIEAQAVEIKSLPAPAPRKNQPVPVSDEEISAEDLPF